ncbi:lipoprotein-releasing ABC transporter permease subunit [Thiomicrorhabdus lithotrophica]|uniref:Lipoprotein-releasing ABC transporter permease subunit n=1 Tax=Thiomicrorhabdus lithotrophica TaxID=2949997 RepID=A0ABY8CHQ8_9GAMM|nr:lipoprotein-releasing ABC transporter permease subunit [Thiomicrorhabdus lithotrophica]WEJ63693.1 lipoprotein-releasing ABC transporter permease subunit [Thiomicrorhabdus lithotrophica]
MIKLPYELLLGLRYTRAKRRNGFISFISLSSMIGIALGVTALITVLSIMNGFQEELRDRILGMTAHMTINERNDQLEDWQSLYNQLINQPHIEGAAPNIMEQGMLTIGNKVKGVAIRGVLPEFEGQVADIGNQMLFGSLNDLTPKKYKIILGSELAVSLGVTLGDKVTLIAPQGSVSPVGIVPRIKRFTVSGIFEAGMHEYDSGLAIIHIEDAKKVFKYGDSVGALQLKIDDLFKVGEVKNQLGQVVDKVLYMRDWRQQHSNFFKAIEMEKRMMFIVLTLIIMVAAFNIVSTMVMVVTDKQSDIAVLRTIGATPMSIQMVFIIQGLVIGTLGVILGLIGGLSLALNIDVIVPFIEQLLGFKFFPPDVYYISAVPSKLVWSDVWYIAGLSFVLTLLATLYPARKASKVNPAEALRYE